MNQETKERSYWEILTACCHKRFYPEEYEFKQIAPFIFVRYLGSDIMTLGLANYLNTYTNIPVKYQFRLAWDLIPNSKKNIRYFTTSKKGQKLDKHILEALQTLYNVREELAVEYAKMLTDEQLQEVLNRVNRGGKE